jgi:Domain of unknown function (DUF4157)/DNA/RNA non-specific endonuclease
MKGRSRSESVREPGKAVSAARTTEPVPTAIQHAPLAKLLDLQRAAGNRATIEKLRGGGQPLDPNTRTFMEERFGQDLGKVRLHTDESAAASAATVDAKAYTVGCDVVFGARRYAPETNEGRQLLAHELAHVVQQSRGGTPPALDATSPLEQAANRAAQSATRDAGPVVVSGACGVGLARQEDDQLPFWKRKLNPLYQRALEVLPDSAAKQLQAANERARQFVEDHKITNDQIDAVVAQAEPVLKPAEQILHVSNPPKPPTPPRPPSNTVWLGRPPLSVQMERRREDREQEAAAKRESPYALPPARPRQGPSPQPEITLADLTATDPAPTEFETQLKSEKEFKLPIRPLPEIDPRQATWLGRRPSDEQLRHTRVEAVGDLPSATTIFVPGDTTGEIKLSNKDVMPVRDNQTHKLLGYRLHMGETVYELDREGHIVLGRGLEAPLEKPPIDPIDIAMLGIDLAPLLAKGIVRIGGKVIASRTVRSAIRSARIGLAGAMIGSAEAIPVLGRGAAGATYFEFPAATSMVEGGVTSRELSAIQPKFRGEGELPVGRVDVPSPAAHAPAQGEIDLGSTAGASGLELETSTKVPFQAEAPGIHDIDVELIQGPTQTTVEAGTEARKGMFLNEFNAAEIGPNRLRFNYNVENGHPNSVEFDVHGGSSTGPAQSSRSFTRDPSIEGRQPSNAAYAGSGWERGHLAQREVFKGFRDAERAADSHATTVPMAPNLNRGAGSPWRASEARTFDYAQQFGTVKVEVKPMYDANPPRLPDGTPIPKAIRRRVTKSNGDLLEDATYLNR